MKRFGPGSKPCPAKSCDGAKYSISWHLFRINNVCWLPTVLKNGTLHIPIKVMNNCFGNGAERISRNPHLAFVSGKQRSSIPETTVNYF